MSSNLSVGRLFYFGYARMGGENWATVRSAGILNVRQNLYIGYDTMTNTLNVTSGGKVFVAGDLYAGFQASDSRGSVVQQPNNNEIFVSGRDSLLSVTGSVFLPRAPEATGARLTLTDGATAVLKDINIGSSNPVYLGSNNVVTISDGASLTSQWIHVRGRLNTIVVDNATMHLSEGLEVGGGYAGFDVCNDAVSVKGTNAHVYATRCIFNSHALIDVEVPAEGFNQSLFQAGSYFSFGTGRTSDTKIRVRVRLSADLKKKKTFTLFKSTGSNIDVQNVEWDLPIGTKLDTSNAKFVNLTVKRDHLFQVILR